MSTSNALISLIDEVIGAFVSSNQITVNKKPKKAIKSTTITPKSKLLIESKSNKDDDDEKFITSFKTSPTNLGRFFMSYSNQNNIDISQLPSNESTLIVPTVGVGNIAQIAIDILLTTLKSKKKIIKIGYFNDRNIISGVGNDAFMTKPKRKNKTKQIFGTLTTPIELYWYKECNLFIIQQRCTIRIGGRSEYVELFTLLTASL